MGKLASYSRCLASWLSQLNLIASFLCYRSLLSYKNKDEQLQVESMSHSKLGGGGGGGGGGHQSL